MPEAEPPSSPAVGRALSVPLPAAVAWAELRGLQASEEEQWKSLGTVRMGGPIAAITLGIPVMVTFVSWGTLLIAEANNTDVYNGDYEGYDVNTERRVGRGLFALGLMGATSIALGAWRVLVQRRKRNAAEQELRAIGMRRALLQQTLEWHYTSSSSAPPP